MENEQNDGQLTDRLMVWFCHLIYGTSVAHSLLCQGYGASVARGVCVCHPLYSAPPERPLAAVSLLLEPMSWMIATPAWGQELIYSASLCSHLTLVKRFRLLGSTVLRRYHAMKRSVSQCDASLSKPSLLFIFARSAKFSSFSDQRNLLHLLFSFAPP